MRAGSLSVVGGRESRLHLDSKGRLATGPGCTMGPWGMGPREALPSFIHESDSGLVSKFTLAQVQANAKMERFELNGAEVGIKSGGAVSGR